MKNQKPAGEKRYTRKEFVAHEHQLLDDFAERGPAGDADLRTVDELVDEYFEYLAMVESGEIIVAFNKERG